MFNHVPIQVWLLLAIAAAAYAPARYLYRHAVHSPARRDITQPRGDLSWRTSGQFALNLAILGALAGFAIFIFMPEARQIAQSPSFWPLLMAAFGIVALMTVARGYSTGHVQPLVRGLNDRYERQSQPKRFWTSMGWNTLLGCFAIWIAFQTYQQADEEQCYDANNAHPQHEVLAACTRLLDKGDQSAEDKARLLAARGFAYYRLGDYQHSWADYFESIRLDPNDASTHFNLGLVDERLENNVDAFADYSEAIRLEPSNVDAYFNRGLVSLRRGKFDQAIADFNRVHELTPDDAMAIANRGLAYAWKRDALKAEQDFAAARALEPSNIVVLRGEAILSIDRGDLAGAVDRLTKALKLDANDAWSLGMRAEAYGRLGEYERMRADRDKLRALSETPINTRLDH